MILWTFCLSVTLITLTVHEEVLETLVCMLQLL